MKKLGKILLLIVNILIGAFLGAIFVIFLLWIIGGISPNQSVQASFSWIQNSWDSLWGIEPKEKSYQISPKFRKRAHRQIYIASPNKRDESAEDIITQPYK